MTITNLPTWLEGATLPALQVWWRDTDGTTLVDFSTGWTFALAVGAPGAAASFTADGSNITGAVGSGDGYAVGDSPNLTIGWAASGQLGTLPPGVYAVDVLATRTSDSRVRKQQIKIEILEGVGE